MESPPERAHPIKVYAVAPFEPVRVGLRDGFGSRAPDMEFIGDCSTLVEMVADSRFANADVLVVDAATLNSGSTPAYGPLMQKLPSLKVLFIGSPAEASAISADTLRWVIRLNTVGFLYRDGTIDRVIDGVRLIASGALVCEAEVMQRVLAELTRPAGMKARHANEQLSEREEEVLRLVAEGLSNKEIARRLYVSEGTVKAHVSHIMVKLGLERRTELVRYALSKGLTFAA
jgi:DNA-binding NarL/FixJ family response regulator